jgi:hypothetical protein
MAVQADRGVDLLRRRKDDKALKRWEVDARHWATKTAQNLALDVYQHRETGARPYRIGLVLDPGEKAWAEIPARFNLDQLVSTQQWLQGEAVIRPWLVTSARVVGRLADD